MFRCNQTFFLYYFQRCGDGFFVEYRVVGNDEEGNFLVFTENLGQIDGNCKCQESLMVIVDLWNLLNNFFLVMFFNEQGNLFLNQHSTFIEEMQILNLSP